MKKVLDEGLKMDVFKTAPDFDKGVFQEALEAALKKLEGNVEQFTDFFPHAWSNNNVYYPKEENRNWTEGFWTGMMWLAWEITVDERYRKAAEVQVDRFIHRIDNKIAVDHHDMGFLYSLSCVAAFKLTGSEKAKTAALKAADQLSNRYLERAGIIRSWSGGEFDEPDKQGNVIIDSMMNMPLLYWASEVTGNPEYRERAEYHAEKTLDNIVREDASTYHMFLFDSETGEPRFGRTAQGYSDTSCWTRGQAWAIYGSILNYRYTKNEDLLMSCKALANYFLNRSPSDLVVYWDFDFTDGSGELRDTSASAITVCGLLELAKWLPEGEEKKYYTNAAFKILKSLVDNYSTIHNEDSNALLLHVVGSIPHNMGVDEACLFGCYYYLEALVRVTREWELYW